jgi:sulfide:quinone oxidoreductase
LTVASPLADRIGGGHIGIVEPSPSHYYQPLWTLVVGGIFPREDSARDETDLIPDEVTGIRDAATAVDPQKRSVATSTGATLTYDFLVVAPGVFPQWTKSPGLAESVGKPGTGVTSNYSYETVAATWEAIRSFQSGTALFTEPITPPVKCGGAPQKSGMKVCKCLRPRLSQAC